MTTKRTKAPPGRARIEYLKVQNFRALREVEFKDLTPLTVLLGPNSVTKIPRPPWDPRTKFRAFSGCHFEPLQQQTPTQGK